jgi:hypothetical protein
MPPADAPMATIKKLSMALLRETVRCVAALCRILRAFNFGCIVCPSG